MRTSFVKIVFPPLGKIISVESFQLSIHFNGVILDLQGFKCSQKLAKITIHILLSELALRLLTVACKKENNDC